jgi:5-methylcytosine-specific restriction endonuclease McrA
MDAATRREVWSRAGSRCEYCGLPQEADPFLTFHVEHVIAKQHGGRDDLSNLALACHHRASV